MPAPTDAASARKVLDFWFSDRVEKRWYDSDPEFDREIVEKFGDLYRYAFEGELSGWTKTAETALALVILLDQFPRNMFRGSPQAYQSDEQAREVSRIAIANSFDQQRSGKEREFFYLPLMHSEDLLDQTECVRLYRRLQHQENLKYAVEHRDIIARFGRFPHRNAILDRQSSEEEQEFLKTHKGF
jgi:uncharacterized protein (DUF924 family)